MQNRHKDLTSLGTGVRLRAEADFHGDHQWAKFSFRQIVICRNNTVTSPMIQSVSLFTKYVLDFLNGRMSGLAIGDIAKNLLWLFAPKKINFYLTGLSTAA
jgi:hypothetical protein